MRNKLKVQYIKNDSYKFLTNTQSNNDYLKRNAPVSCAHIKIYGEQQRILCDAQYNFYFHMQDGSGVKVFLKPLPKDCETIKDKLVVHHMINTDNSWMYVNMTPLQALYCCVIQNETTEYTGYWDDKFITDVYVGQHFIGWGDYAIQYYRDDKD